MYSPKNDSSKKRVIDLWEQFKDITKFPNIKICDDPKKIGSLFKEFNASKKNIQRKKGIKLTKNMSDVLEGRNNGYVVVQNKRN